MAEIFHDDRMIRYANRALGLLDDLDDTALFAINHVGTCEKTEISVGPLEGLGPLDRFLRIVTRVRDVTHDTNASFLVTDVARERGEPDTLVTFVDLDAARGVMLRSGVVLRHVFDQPVI